MTTKTMHPETMMLHAGPRCDVGTGADEHRQTAQRGVVPLLDRGIERVEISVEDAGFPGHEHMFACRSDTTRGVRAATRESQ